ncbi:190_t:CDS:2, partial [Funneliformis geosporum]
GLPIKTRLHSAYRFSKQIDYKGTSEVETYIWCSKGNNIYPQKFLLTMIIIDKDILKANITLPPESEYVWYLGYGSNMSKKTLERMRKVKPRKSIACTVPNYFLSFDIYGQPYFEPAFASIYPHPLHSHSKSSITYEYAKDIHNHCCPGLPFKFNPEAPEKSLPPILNGILYLISKQEYQHILNTEGGWGYGDLGHGYKAIDVECITYDNQKLIAKTLSSQSASVEAGCQPSLRYLNLLRVGAKEHNLSPDYQDYLNSLKHFEISTTSKKIARILYFTFSIPSIFFFILFASISLKFGKRLPKSIAKAMIFVINISRANYNNFFKPLFGSGTNND